MVGLHAGTGVITSWEHNSSSQVITVKTNAPEALPELELK
jgi:hypothetical protein